MDDDDDDEDDDDDDDDRGRRHFERDLALETLKREPHCMNFFPPGRAPFGE